VPIASSLRGGRLFNVSGGAANVRKAGEGKRNHNPLFTLHQEFHTLVPRVEILSSSARKEEARTPITKEFQPHLISAELLFFKLIVNFCKYFDFTRKKYFYGFCININRVIKGVYILF